MAYKKVMIGAKISTHALREEGDIKLDNMPWATDISTHALREEGDSKSDGNPTRFTDNMTV